ncbi:MAG: DUF935 domain-containing protein [Rhizobiaceae bacterium]|nr:DUF935 domain-containing protein [Rhizobiaceae bacterium]MCO5083388.1 DUF935 domain-containing protein [Rhizobiaceae bacterium]
MVKSTILGPDGRPIEKKLLAREVAAPTISGVRRVHEERVATSLTPERLGSLLRDAALGQARAYLTLAEEMEERYLHYASQLQTRRLAIESVDVTVEAPKGVPSKIIEAVEELTEESAFEEAIGALTDGIAKSYAVSEMMWEYERGALRPVEYIWRDQRFFQFDRLALSELRLAVDGSIEGEELPPAKFLRHLPRSKMGIPLRRGVARPAAWAYMIQQFALQDWAGFAEVYGMPLRVGKYNAGASESDKRTLLKAVASIANDAAAIIPDGMAIDFHEVKGSQGSDVFGGLLEYVDKQISKLVVGQTMTSDDGSSLGQAKIHNEVRLDILRADAKQLAATVNRDLVHAFVAMNFGPQDVYPQIKMPVPDPEDLEVLTKAVQAMVPLGLKVKQSEMREKIGLSEPSDEDELLSAPRPAASPNPEDDDEEPAKVPAPKPGKDKAKEQPKKIAALSAEVADHKRSCRCRSCVSLLAAETVAARADAQDDVDALLEEAFGDWEQLTAPIVDPLFAIIEKATSFEQALAMLQSAGPDATKLAERLAVLTAIGRGIGDTKD